MTTHELKKMKDSDPFAHSQTDIRPARPFIKLASGAASLLGVLFAAIASNLISEGLHQSAKLGIRGEYVPFAASILSAIVGLTVIFILARAFYKQRVQSRARLTENVRMQEKTLFELTERDFDALVGAHGRR